MQQIEQLEGRLKENEFVCAQLLGRAILLIQSPNDELNRLIDQYDAITTIELDEPWQNDSEQVFDGCSLIVTCSPFEIYQRVKHGWMHELFKAGIVQTEPCKLWEDVI